MCTTCNQSQPTGDCPACSEENERAIQCSDCEEYYPDGAMEEIDGLQICPDCADNYIECERCGDKVHKDFITNVYEVLLCENCVGD